MDVSRGWRGYCDLVKSMYQEQQCEHRKTWAGANHSFMELKGRRWLFCAVGILMLSVSCVSQHLTSVFPGSVSVEAQSSASSAERCVPPSRVKRGFYVLRGHCPSSEPVAVGGTRKITLGMVHKSVCWWPADFAGSFWMTHTYLPSRAMSAMHGGVTGRMKLVTKDRAVFHAPAIRTRQRLSEPFRRVPARGGFLLRFHRIEGGIRTAGCD